MNTKITKGFDWIGPRSGPLPQMRDPVERMMTLVILMIFVLFVFFVAKEAP